MRIRIALAALFVLFASTGWSADYYVDATSGSDLNNGRSEGSAWKSIAKVNGSAFQPGDRILFRRGETWRENLTPQSSGTAQNPIVFDAYGSGDKPRILGSDSRSGTGYWKYEGGNLWYTEGITWDPKMVFHEGLGSSRKSDKSRLQNPWDWWHDAASGRIYFYLSENPGNYPIEIPRRNGVGWAWSSYSEFRNFEIAYAEFGIAFWGGDHWTLEDLDIHDVTVSCIIGHNASSGNVVRNSVFTDWNWNGFEAPTTLNESLMGYGIQIISLVSAAPSEDWRIENNRFYMVDMKSGEDSTPINIDQQGHASLIAGNYIDGGNATGGGGCGIMFWRPKSNLSTIIRGNIVRNIGGVGLNVAEFNVNNFNQEVLVEGNIIENTCTHDVLDQEALRIWTRNSSKVYVRNNLVNGTRDGSNLHHGIRVRQSNVTLENNTVYGTDYGISFESGAYGTVQNTISAGNRMAALNVDGVSSCSEENNLFRGGVRGHVLSPTTIQGEPLFIGAGSGNFRLQGGSPAIDAGKALPTVTTGLDGNSRPIGDGWDIGCYEFARKIPGTPGNLRFTTP